MKPPSLFPLYDPSDNSLNDGTVHPIPAFCHRAFSKGTTCSDHYRSMADGYDRYRECPFGFTTRTFHANGFQYIVTGTVAYPRFGSAVERQRAKDHPETRTTRAAIDGMVRYLQEADSLRADAVQTGAKVLPQAFHELRKLNGAVLQHAEKELRLGPSAALQTIKSAAELMRNNFDILEALSNIDAMRALPLGASVNLYDLCYKTKKVFDERAIAKGMNIALYGVRAIISGSQKSFPIVPAVLIENAIKYGRNGTSIRVDVDAAGNRALLAVENESDHAIDPTKCFERGTRYAATAAEGGGFGLFLAKQIVEAHHGNVVCEHFQKRVRFVVNLPLDRVVPADW